jgi:hypothetical protein
VLRFGLLVLAVLLAGILGLLELLCTVRAPMCPRSRRWVLCRMAVDGGFAGLAYVVLSVAANPDPSFPIALAAGLGGPVALRSKFIDVGQDQKLPVGLLYVHDRACGYFDRRIRQINATEQSAFIEVIVPAITRRMDAAELQRRTRSYFYAEQDSEELPEWLEATLEEDTPESDKVAAIVVQLVRLGHDDFVRSLAPARRTAKRRRSMRFRPRSQQR